ncbi:alpha/beta fold hydrolase [Pelagibius sp. CAU 1746]|uniref:alpha/beta fold hydrolase n=1 Tax=Pelagibius sp. CAU 1746 TaxID=3140370 RepID=UPI00325B3E70
MTTRLSIPSAMQADSLSACAISALPGRLVMRPAEGREMEAGGRPDYFLFQPEDADLARPPLVAVHGISRNAEAHVKAFAEVAVAQRRLLIAPHFDERRFDGFQRVARGTEAAVDSLWRDVERVTGRALDRVDMLGFSGGAQFAHRYAMLHPQRVASLILVAAGWYTFPSETDRFPYGVMPSGGRGRRAAANLAQFLAIPTLVLVGSRDCQRDAALRQTPDVDIKQGLNRVERGGRWSCAVLQTALRLGVAPRVQFAMLPGCGHAFDDCVAVGGLAGFVNHWLQR